MNKFESVTESLGWFIALLLVAFVAGCGSSTSTTSPVSSAKALTSFTVGGLVGTVVGTIDEPAKTVALTVPNGTNVTAMVATFTATGASVKVGTTVQTSATTANDFTGPVTYTVTAADGSTAAYTVTVTVASASAKAITAYSFAAYPAAPVTINELAKTIAVTVPYGTNVTALVATFTTTGASVTVDAVAQVSGTTPLNFTTSKAYVVTAGDTTTATYTVTVTVAPNNAKAITAYSFVGYSGAPVTINESAKTIVVTLPYGTTVTALVATFTTTGTGVPTVAGVNQVSGTTPNNFTTSKAYLVTAADSTTATYTVTVVFAANTAKAITAYSFVGYAAYPGIITEPAHTIAVILPSGSDITSLTATFTSTGTGPVTIGGVTQVSGAAPTNNFTTTKSYLVTAADSTTATYVVTVTVSSATTVLPGAGANPTVLLSSPSDSDIFVPTRSNSTVAAVNNTKTGKLVTATFSEAMLPGTVATAFTLYDDTAASGVAGVVTMSAADKIATFMPGADLIPAHTYTATITTAAQVAAAGNAPISNTVAWSFTTNATALTGEEPVDLLSVLANNFVILAEVNGISDVPTSAITGNIGVSSTAGGTAIGVPCSEMTGTIYSPDAGGPACATIDATLLTTAVSDMGTASVEAAGRTQLVPVTGLGAGNISGMTLTPGIYTWSTSLLINTGASGDATGVTLDCQGNSSAVFIFQSSQFLTVGSGAHVNLIGGCQAKNIFWSLAGDATLSSTSVFNGTILTATQAVMQSGAALHGRALAHTWVTLITNSVGP